MHRDTVTCRLMLVHGYLSVLSPTYYTLPPLLTGRHATFAAAVLKTRPVILKRSAAL